MLTNKNLSELIPDHEITVVAQFNIILLLFVWFKVVEYRHMSAVYVRTSGP